MAVALAACGHSNARDGDNDAKRALRHEAHALAVTAAQQPPQPQVDADCGPSEPIASQTERERLRSQLRTHLRSDVRAFFLEARRRRDLVARMVTTNRDAARLTARNMADEIVGHADISACGGESYLRAVLQGAFADALTDALDDDQSAMTWETAERFDRLEPVTDSALRIAVRTSSFPLDQYQGWLEQMLFYLGKISPDESRGGE